MMKVFQEEEEEDIFVVELAWRIAPNSVSLVLFTLCYLGWKTMEIDGENWTQDIGQQEGYLEPKAYYSWLFL